VSDVQVLPATGAAEREAALMMIGSVEGVDAVTVRADKGYDTKTFVAECRQMNATPHVAQKARHSAIDGRTTRHAGYGTSQQKRKRVEEVFGWMKMIGGMRKLQHRGLELVGCSRLLPRLTTWWRIRNLSSAIEVESV